MIPPTHVVARQSTDVVAVTDPNVSKAISYIRHNYFLPIGVSDIAAHAGVSRRTLERRFRQWMPHSPEAELMKVRLERAMELLRMVEMEDQYHKVPSTVSGGQKQRAAIARALANDPALIVADEPTGNLDTATSEVIFQLFEHLVQQGKTIIMVTHDRSLAERFDRVLRIVDGEVTSATEETLWQA